MRVSDETPPWAVKQDDMSILTTDSIQQFLIEHEGRKYTALALVRAMGCEESHRNVTVARKRLMSLARFHIIEKSVAYNDNNTPCSLFYYQSMRRQR